MAIASDNIHGCKITDNAWCSSKKNYFALSVFHFGTRDTVFLLEMVPFHDLDHFSAHFSVLELEYRFIFTIVTSTVAKKVCSCAPKNGRYTMERNGL